MRYFAGLSAESPGFARRIYHRGPDLQSDHGKHGANLKHIVAHGFHRLLLVPVLAPPPESHEADQSAADQRQRRRLRNRTGLLQIIGQP